MLTSFFIENLETAINLVNTDTVVRSRLSEMYECGCCRFEWVVVALNVKMLVSL